jgi:hypothetical protein
MGMKAKIEKFLKGKYGQDCRLLSVERIGTGIHGTAYLLKFRHDGGERRLIMKTLFPSGFGHDHFSDRAQVLLLANSNYNEMPGHIKTADIAGETPEELISLKQVREFYLFMEEARGSSYFKDLDEILRRGELTENDRKRVKGLAQTLAKIHEVKYTGENADTLYRRRIRELIGHGECIMGIIDAYDKVKFATEKDLVEYAGECLRLWGKIRDKSDRLCRVHGDYHPGNIWFDGDRLTLLDRSRGSWGEPADDISCLGINYIYYALKDCDAFKGPFSELFHIFMKAYMEQRQDDGFFEVAQPFFAFRALVLANPQFYQDDSVETKKRLLSFGRSTINTERFDPEKIQHYLESK